MTDTRRKAPLAPVVQKFILHWGEMGVRWGINRTVAQVHALLYLSPQPLTAEEIAATLSVARSNVSTSVRELKSWGIVRVVHLLGDRRDHFESLTDVWEIFRVIATERKRREIDPTRTAIADCVEELKASPHPDPTTEQRLENMLELLTVMSGLVDEMLQMPPERLKGMVRLRGKLTALLGTRR